VLADFSAVEPCFLMSETFFRKLVLEELVHGSSADWSLKQHWEFSLK